MRDIVQGLETSGAKFSFDVVIIGAGVAGSSLAVQLARAGCRVALVEKLPIGANKLSTHFIWPRGLSYLSRLGIDVVKSFGGPLFKDVNFNLEGYALSAPVSLNQLSARLIQAHGSAAGARQEYACIRRQKLDSYLIALAQKAGASYFAEHTLVEVKFDSNRDVVDAVLVQNRKGEVTTLKAEIFVAADGRRSVFALLTDNPVIEEHMDSTAAIWTYYSGIAPAEVALGKRGRFGAGVASTSCGVTMAIFWGPSTDAGSILKMQDEEFAENIVKLLPDISSAFKQGKRVEPFYRASNLSSFRRKSTHRGVYFLGDSVCFKDQCTASGITHALADAEFASEAIQSYFRGEKDSHASRLEYTLKRESDRRDFFVMACSLAQMSPASSDDICTHIQASLDPGAASSFVSLCADSNKLHKDSYRILGEPVPKTTKEVYSEPVACAFI